MSLLPDRLIKLCIEKGDIKIDPYDESMIQPASIDVKISRFFRVFHNSRRAFIDPKKDMADLTELVEITPRDFPGAAIGSDEGYFTLHPGEFALSSTEEVFTLGDTIGARIEGKSSLGRLGLVIHSTAGFIDPGFNGPITLEMSNLTRLPIKIYPGMPIGQIAFEMLQGRCENPYTGKYQGSRGPDASRYHLNFQEEPEEEPTKTHSNSKLCRCWNEGQWGRVHREDCPIHKDEEN